MKPQYKHLTFKSQKAFDEWLEATTTRSITFVDFFQDLLKIWIAENGEILHANLQASVWNGCFVHLKTLQECKPIELWETDQWKPYGKLIVDTITLHTS